MILSRLNAKGLLFAMLMIPGYMATAQTADLPVNHELYHFIDRMDIKGLTGGVISTDIKPYSRSYITKVMNSVQTDSMNFREHKWFENYQLLASDSAALLVKKKGILKTIYTNRRDFAAVSKENFRLFINPVIYFSVGTSRNDYAGAEPSQSLWRNSRGGQLRGTILKRVGFFTEVTDNQARYPQFIRNSFNQYDVIWGEGFVKPFKTTGYDFFNARGYITYSPVEQFRIKFGKDRAFWGNGYQSLAMSDYAADHLMLDLNTRIWKLEYTNHFAQFTDYIKDKPDAFGVFPKKYGAFHQLSFRPNKNLSFSAFETVVYSPNLPGGQRGFELEYLNPIIFYRSVEQFLGSPDNSMLGVSAKANFLRHFQAYGQFLLDDFNFSQRKNGSGYWGNKFGYQIGGKYIDAFGVMGLDLQGELNRVRPYTYSHFNPAANFSHYGQFLAHPMGANFTEIALNARYQPFSLWYVQGGIQMIQKGVDSAGRNFGGDIFLPYGSHFQDFNNTIGQGASLSIFNVWGKVSWQIFSFDAFIELEGRFRKENDNTDVSALGTLRVNIPSKPVKF